MNHKEFWFMVATYYRVRLPDITYHMYAEDTKHIPVETLISMFDKYRKTPRGSVMPMPNVFLQMFEGKISADDMANIVPLRIFEAVRKFGWSRKDEARDYIGEIGWQIVEMRGGWAGVCENLGTNWDEGVFIAQSREMTKSLLKASELGYGDKPISLVSSSKAQCKLEHGNNVELEPKVTDY